MSNISVDVAAALLSDPELAAARVAVIAAERDRFSGGLRDAGWDPQPSTTNFVLVTFASPAEAEAVAEGLLARGLIPRTFGEGHPLAHSLRLTVRNPEQDDRLIEAANEIGRPEVAVAALSRRNVAARPGSAPTPRIPA